MTITSALLECWSDSKLGILLKKAKTWTNNWEQSAQSDEDSWMTVSAKEGLAMNREDGQVHIESTHTISGTSSLVIVSSHCHLLERCHHYVSEFLNVCMYRWTSYSQREKALLEAEWLLTMRFAWTPYKRTVQKESSLSNKCNFRGY